MEKIIDKIFDLSEKKEGKNLLEMTLKCSEEVGELAQAVLSYTNASGCGYKKLGPDNIKEEIVDIFIVSTALAVKAGMSKEEMITILERKINKWEEIISKKIICQN